MNAIKRRISSLLGVDEKYLNIIQETEDQYIVLTKDHKNFVYSVTDDTLIDFDSLSNKDKTSEKYLTMEEKNEYYENNQGLIGFALRKINRIDGIEAEELKDICILGFAKALSNFNKNEGIKFSTYCVRCMLNELYYYLRKEQRKLMFNTSFDKELTNDKDGTSVKVGDLIDSRVIGGRSVEDNALNSELKNVLLDCISNLEDDEQFLIIYRYGLNDDIILTQNVIAEKLEMSQANISKLEKTCLRKLRILMKKKNYIYNAKSKMIEKNPETTFNLGADEKYNYLEKDSNENILLIAAERLRLNIEDIDEIIPTKNKNEFIVTFHTNKRVYAIVNNITTFVSLQKKELSKDDRFMEFILKKPIIKNPTRDDVDTEIYNIEYDYDKLKNEISNLSKKEKYIITHMYGILNTKQMLASDISEKLKIDVSDIQKIRIKAMKKLQKKFK